MPTEKPRVTITISEEQLKQVDDYRYSNKMKNQTQAILSLVRKGLETIEHRYINNEYEKEKPSEFLLMENMRRLLKSLISSHLHRFHVQKDL